MVHYSILQVKKYDFKYCSYIYLFKHSSYGHQLRWAYSPSGMPAVHLRIIILSLSLGALKMQDRKMQDQIAGHENAGPENGGPSRNAASLCS